MCVCVCIVFILGVGLSSLRVWWLSLSCMQVKHVLFRAWGLFPTPGVNRKVLEVCVKLIPNSA